MISYTNYYNSIMITIIDASLDHFCEYMRRKMASMWMGPGIAKHLYLKHSYATSPPKQGPQDGPIHTAVIQDLLLYF